MRLLIILCLIIALSSSALAQLKRGGVAVDKDGSVTLEGKAVGKLPMPPKATALVVRRVTLQGHKLLQVTVKGAGEIGRAHV